MTIKGISVIYYYLFQFSFFNFIAQEIKICLFHIHYAFVLVVLGFCRIMQNKTFLSIEVNQ